MPAEILLVGDATTTYTTSDQTGVGRVETFQFTAAHTGTVEKLLLRTNGTANTGISSVVLGVMAENAGKPGAVLGQATFTGLPGTNVWVEVTGLSISVVSGTKYWLAMLPLGTGGSFLHFNVSKSAGGNLETIATGLTKIEAETEWATFNEGPIGFQGLGTETPAAPLLTKPATQTTEKGKPVALSVANSGGASAEWTATELPAGLSVSPTTGEITGTVTTVQTKTVTVKAKNAGGTSEVLFEWKIIAEALLAPALTNPGEQTTTEGNEVNLTVTNTGGAVEAVGWSAVELPTGLSINSTTGVITGKPTTPQTKSVKVKAKNATGSVEVAFTWGIVAIVTGSVNFKVKTGKSGMKILAVRNSNGNLLSLTLAGTYTTSDPNEIWAFRNLFAAYVEEV